MPFAKTIIQYFLLGSLLSVNALDSSLESDLNFGAFKSWAKTFEKTYDTVEEEVKRMRIWIENHEFIKRHNEQLPAPTFAMEHNHFSDMTNDEYRAYNKLGNFAKKDFIVEEEDIGESPSKAVPVRTERLLFATEDLPESVNWVEQGAVTEVKNQGRCGSCWSFSAVGAIEGAKFLKDGELVSLSEQMMMDCDYSDYSCEGGLMGSAFKWEGKEGGLCTEAAYPYLAKDIDFCWDANCTVVPDTDVVSMTRMEGGDAEELMGSITIQPTSIAMNAATMEFQFYKDGVFNSTCGAQLDHGVLAVGYGFDEPSGMKYFLMKNSWGPMWGDSGYFKISMFQAEEGDMGMCGILNQFNVAPTVA